MRVLHTMWAAAFGGIAKMVLDLALEQVRSGLHVGVLLGRKEGEFLSRFEEAEIPIHSLDLRHGFDLSSSRLSACVDIIRGYDIVHMHGFTPAVVSSSLRSRKRVVFTEHGLFGFGRHRTFSDRVKFTLQRLYLNRGVDFVTFNSETTQQLAKARFGLKRTASAVVYNGVSYDRTEAAHHCLDQSLEAALAGKFVVGTVARFAGVKRIEILLEAYAEFQQERESLLLLVGDGPLRRQYQTIARGLGIADSTLFTGYQVAVQPFLRAMDVCVLPSYNESFGLVAVEALSCGRPTLVMSDGGGVCEVIQRLEPQDVVADVNGLAERITDYYERPELISDALASRVDFAKQFSIKVTASEFHDIYSGLMNAGAPPHGVCQPSSTRLLNRDSAIADR